jgi:hypothetical protein
MKLKLFAISIALLMTQSTFANNNANPTSCPTVDAFKNTGVSSVIRDTDGTWITLEWKNQFSTEFDWTFMIGNIAADFPSDALAKGNATISGLVYQYGPVEMDPVKQQVWYCVYEDPATEMMAVAMTPPAIPEINKMVKLVHKK